MMIVTYYYYCLGHTTQTLHTHVCNGVQHSSPDVLLIKAIYTAFLDLPTATLQYPATTVGAQSDLLTHSLHCVHANA